MEIKQREYKSEFNKLTMRIGKEFSNGPGFQKMQNYLRGLLGPVERKNALSQTQRARLLAGRPSVDGKCPSIWVKGRHIQSNSLYIGEDTARTACGMN